jgi:NADH-quinone oxidoreductase subunit L
MTVPLVVLAVGSVFVGYLGLPAWLGPNVFEHFLEPAFETRYHAAGEPIHAAHSTEILLTLVSVALAGAGIYLAYHFFLKRKEKADSLRQKYAGLHSIVYNKYYVDELYDFLFVDRAKGLGRFLSAFDNNVVDGAVNGSAAMTKFVAWGSGLFDMGVVDRIVNLVAEIFGFFSTALRKIQTGLVQRYALFFVIGIILVISFYLYMGV